MKETCHSEWRSIKTLYMASPQIFWGSQKSITDQWEKLNYLEEPDFLKSREEHQFLVEQIQNQGVDVQFFEGHSSDGLDTVYCRDASIFTDAGVVLCRMGKSARAGEPEMQEQYFRSKSVPILGRIESPGTLEGGDVAWLDEQTLAVAHGYRTNDAGFQQLSNLLAPLGVTVIQVPLPHHKGPGDVFHLMSIFSPVAKDLAVVYSPLMPVKFRQMLLSRGIELVEVPESEFESMGCNVLALAPRKCVMVAGNPHTQSHLEQTGCEVIAYEGKHISLFGGGGPTCLTRPSWRL